MNINPGNTGHLKYLQAQLTPLGISESAIKNDSSVRPAVDSQKNILNEGLKKFNMEVIKQLNRMEQREIAALIRDLLGFPKTFHQLIQLSHHMNSSYEADITRIILDLNLLKEFFAHQGKDILNKLIKLFQHGQMAEYDDQFQNLLKLVAIYPDAEKWTPSETMTQTVLLYLPWMPLDKQGFMIQMFDGINQAEENAAQSENKIILYIDTETLGQLKVTLMEDIEHPLSYFIELDKNYKQFLKNLYRLIDNNLKQENDLPEKGKNDYDKVKALSKREFSVNTSGKISYSMFKTAMTIARIIIETSHNPGCLISQEMLNN